MNIEDTLQERGKRYGDYALHAEIADNIVFAMRSTDVWDNLSCVQQQALRVIADKIARILNGDPDYIDNWHDIAGYSTLVVRWLQSGMKTCL